MPEIVCAVGDTLRRERVRRGLTPKEAADATNLPKSTVVGLEAATLPLDDVPTRASLRIYARSLGVDSEGILRRLEDGDRSAPPHMVPAGADGSAPPTAPPAVAALKDRPQWPALLGVALLAAVLGVGGVLWSASDGAEDSTVALTAPEPAEGAARAEVADGEAPGDPSIGAGIDPPSSASEDDSQEPVEVLPSARPPEETQIQLLHNGLTPAVLAEVTETLEALDYPVVAVNSARRPFRRTTVFFVDGWQPEAEALRARDSRFAAVAPNQDFAAEISLHIAIGADWDPGAAQS